MHRHILVCTNIPPSRRIVLRTHNRNHLVAEPVGKHALPLRRMSSQGASVLSCAR
jgi:hypothetical protein